MITLINCLGINTFSGLPTHTPSPPLGPANVAAALGEAGFEYRLIAAMARPSARPVAAPSAC